MSEQERRRSGMRRNAAPGPGPDDGGSEVLQARRRAAEELLKAGDSLIDDLLSQDSARFLQSNRQRGGQ